MRLRSNKLPLQHRRRAHHRPALFLDIDRDVLACELAKLFFGRFQVLTDSLQTPFQEDALARADDVLNSDTRRLSSST